MLVLKMPLALFGLLFLAGRARLEHGQAWDAAFLFIPFAVILAFFSLWVRPQLGIRYVLPGVIPLFVYAGRAAATTGRRTFLIRALVAWHAISVFIVSSPLHVVLQRADRTPGQRLPFPGGLD
jgi:hypothetical protein